MGGIATIATTALAVQARREFNSTDLEATANDASDRHRTYSIAAGVTGGLTLVLTALAIPLLRAAKKSEKKKK